METALSQLSYLPTTKEQVSSFVQNAKQEILSGGVDVKKLIFQKRLLEDVLDGIFKDEDVKTCLNDQIELYGKEGVNYEGLKIQVKERRTFDFSACSDSEWNKLDEEVKSLNKKKKNREKFLKTITKALADPETGEIINPAPFDTLTFITSSYPKND